MSRILLLEDDLSLITGLSFAFKKQGFEADNARTLREADTLWADRKYDLLVLDVSLPDGSGLEFCQRVRHTSKVPIIFLTASDEETSIIMGLDIGGDDYITKPFKLGVLISRINALLRRASAFGAADTELCSNGIKVLLLQGQVFKNGDVLELTAAEYKLLCLFMHNPNTVLNAHADNELREKEFLKSTISDISHQLKTPLAALNIYNGLMQDEDIDAGTVKEFAELSEQELDRIETLVQSLLKITRLDAGSIVFEKDTENVADMMGRSKSTANLAAARCLP